jgi:hypothetical protein
MTTCPKCGQPVERPGKWLKFTLEQVKELDERFEHGGIIGYWYHLFENHLTGEVTYAPGRKERFYALR